MYVVVMKLYLNMSREIFRYILYNLFIRIFDKINHL